MSHERMLAWLDQANSGTVRSAADRLTAAAEEIRRIGEELKVRPQYVDWQGEGADVFRTWAGDLANSTLRLGDFSDDAAKWLGQASDAIAGAQASIPRDTKSARANPNTTTPAHNDPGVTTVTTKSASELAALATAKEKIRQEAAAQMLKLGQSYRLSATQLDGLERPTFPPPPTGLQPTASKRDENEVVSAGGTSGRTSSTGGVAGALSVAAARPTTARTVDDTRASTGESHPRTTVQRPSPEGADQAGQVGVKVDGTQVSPLPSVLPVSPVGPPDEGRTVGSGAVPTGTMPPPVSGGVRNSSSTASGPGRATNGGHAAAQPARRSTGPLSRSVSGTGVEGGPAGTARPVTGGRSSGPPGRETAQPTPGRAVGGNGITGGRPTSPAAGSSVGRRVGGLPRGTVVGGETDGATGRGPAGQRSSTGAGGAGAGQRATPAGRRGAGDGVVGGRPQPQGRSGSGRFTPGGSGLVRNQDASDAVASASSARGRMDVGPSGSRSPNTQRNGDRGKKTGGRSEEEEPGQQTGHSNA
ncbi:translation initiation factor IF-2 [Streptomyces sp. W16]|uniref:translation initiation factor IF-2 n=1 Tax=Streptomyces sp. W16 TaxID=3076631 RepID=UPI00295ABE1A|nr:translation initiation factor IF-2 [Streptomyces sp. W16]MDV9170190.1 translation initiation factor IF-2 [Streptomyces sp. W16]